MSLERDRGPDSTLARDLEAFRLILDTVYVVGQQRGRRNPEALTRLTEIDPASAQRIHAEYWRITWTWARGVEVLTLYGKRPVPRKRGTGL